MSNRLRTLLIVVVVVLMAATSFLAGYLTKEYVERPVPQREVVETGEFAIFAEAWEKVGEKFIGELPTDTQVEYGAIRGSLQQLNDPYTVFLEPVVREEERESLRGNFGGVGATLTRDEATGNIILEPIDGNPAQLAGVLSGDVLVAVDGVEVLTTETVGQIAERIKGEVGTEVVLSILREGSTEPTEITIERGEILIPSVSFRLLREDASIGYIQLTRFSGESGDEVKLALQTLLEIGAKQFILDLRHNGGGLLDAAVFVSDHFLSEEVVFIQLSRGEDDRPEKTFPDTVLPDAPLVVLINGGTASSAEIVAGALQDNGRATLIGERTFGKGSVQLVYDLSDGSSVHVTWARWLTPNGHEIDQNGLTPTIEIGVTQEAIDNGRDEQLERAVQFLQTGE